VRYPTAVSLSTEKIPNKYFSSFLRRKQEKIVSLQSEFYKE
jgi:archaellum biogenesis protein FlaJ (TadC family)